jgi:hypothetical protein
MQSSSSQSPLIAFLRTLSEEHNAQDRRAIAVGLSSFAGAAALHFDINQAQLLGGGGTPTLKEQAGVAVVFHLFWKLIPERIFQPGEPNYRQLAKDALLEFAISDNNNDIWRTLTVVYKRLRQQAFERRVATSLDLSRADHGRLLETQGGLCATCGHSFTKADIDLYLEDEYVLRVPQIPVVPGEIVLETIMRAPVLDHILPIFLGGDSPSNWQILCRSCNAGKGEMWSSLVRAASPPSKVDDVLVLRPMLRYIILAEYGRIVGAPKTELHIVKRRSSGLITLHNLVAVPSPSTTNSGAS